MDETPNPPTENAEELNIQHVSSSQLLDNVCKNYAQYLEIDATKEVSADVGDLLVFTIFYHEH